ncbi:hypothetical protein DWB61_10995 [Ancylomarina euxinus]|uniref:Uncharacterized protein n=1 Tax=Ancylomarina euxinus TaxID=2283627 RepID=A0A425Y051_9BACT|nr:hypothetical protein [Ancylomarina euxinus]MCZ4695420.1 hypothetical protein [Ancylomarina euxinus]MUP15616.1 hypothetical protein [Ancylomarina euxinus]RRG20944.1 hypothetical protein DWB61_10995 [Ancylomarina euxinus]
MKKNIDIKPNYYLLRKLILMLFLMGGLVAFSQKKTAEIQCRFIDDESDKRIAIQIFQRNGSDLNPVEELDVLLYVERLFTNLPLGDRFNTTDEKGLVEIKFPSDLPGDSIGNLNLIIKIEDAETIRDTIIYTKVKWGIPVLYDRSEEKRSLWSARANAPLTLLILVNVLLLGVWGIIFYICYEMYLIKKE